MINFVLKDRENVTEESHVRVTLNARRSTDGNVLIFDHPLIDICIERATHKLILFPKEEVNDETYQAQDRLMKYCRLKGVIDPNSVQGGNIYGAIEAGYPEESEDGEPIQHLIFGISRFLEEELPGLEFIKAYKKGVLDPLTDPSVEDSTELGEIPHEREQGTLNTAMNNYNSIYRAY